MIDYKFLLYRGGTLIAELTEVSSIDYGYVRNGFKNCTDTVGKDDYEQV